MKEHPLTVARRRSRLRKKRIERLNEAEHRIGRLTSMIATMTVEKERLLIEAVILRERLNYDDE